MPANRKQLTREDWVAAAKKVLIKSGADDVKIDQIARRLKISRGSFYWHFRSRADLMEALLNEWESRNRLEIEQVKWRWSNGLPSIDDVVEICMTEDPSFPTFGIAVRIWARSSARVAQVVRRIDEEWLDLLVQIFRQDGRSDIESRARAMVAYYHPIGFHLMNSPRDAEDRLSLAPIISGILTGRTANAAAEDQPPKGRRRKV